MLKWVRNAPSTPSNPFPRRLLKAVDVEKALIVLPEKDETVERAAANILGVKTTLVGTLNTYEVLKYKKLILTKDSVANIEEVYV